MTTVPPRSGLRRHPSAETAVPYRTSTRENLITIALGWWLLGGIFLDGWAHNQLGDSLESFFTPWHAVFYSGFAAVSG